jgi:ribosomal protein S18 acetylase RimI-like enzyme
MLLLQSYEVQISEAVRRQGLGRAFMETLENLGNEYGMQKVMLTVFADNAAAVQFYRKLGYINDPISPNPEAGSTEDDDSGDEYDYFILSKSLEL